MKGDTATGYTLFLQERFDSDEVKDALSFIRMAFFDDRSRILEFAKPQWQFSWFKPRKNNYPPFSIANETNTLKALKGALEAKRKEYTRSYEDEVEML